MSKVTGVEIPESEEFDFPQGTEAEETPAEGTVIEEAPAEGTVIEEAPAKETEIEEAPAEETQTGSPIVTYAKSHPALIGAFGLILLILVLLLISSVRKKKASASNSLKERTEPDGTAEVTAAQEGSAGQNDVSVDAGVLHEMGAREDQQDSYGVSEYMNASKGMLAVVADGMGGLTNGKAVSSLTVKTCMDVFYSLPNYVSHADMLLQMAIQSNTAVNQLLRAGGKSGSTLVAASVAKGRLHFLTIGDSRIYLFRGGALLQLNREHIYREELILRAMENKISIHQTNYDLQAEALTSYLGIGRVPYLDRNYDGIKLLNKDKIILASDGVFGSLTEEQMEQALKLPVTEAADRLREMVQASNKPHQDNYTAVVLEYNG